MWGWISRSSSYQYFPNPFHYVSKVSVGNSIGPSLLNLGRVINTSLWIFIKGPMVSFPQILSTGLTCFHWLALTKLLDPPRHIYGLLGGIEIRLRSHRETLKTIPLSIPLSHSRHTSGRVVKGPSSGLRPGSPAV